MSDLRVALVAIQEQHKGKACKFDDCACMVCVHCAREYPCPTRRLADEALKQRGK